MASGCGCEWLSYPALHQDLLLSSATKRKRVRNYRGLYSKRILSTRYSCMKMMILLSRIECLWMVREKGQICNHIFLEKEIQTRIGIIFFLSSLREDDRHFVWRLLYTILVNAMPCSWQLLRSRLQLNKDCALTGYVTFALFSLHPIL